MDRNRTRLYYVLVSLLIVLSISLSFIGCEKQTPKGDQSSVTEDTTGKEYDLRERCESYCIDFFEKVYRDKVQDKSDNYTVYSDYVNHYNKIKNRCYMLVKSHSVPKKKMGPDITTEYIIDVHENKTFGEFTISVKEKVIDAQKNKKIQEFTISGKEEIVSECKVLDEKCKSKGEWDKLTKPYMDEDSSILKIDMNDLLSYETPQS